MIPPQRFHEAEWRIPGVNGIMQAAINEVSQQKAGKERESRIPDEQVLYPEYQRCEDQAGHRWHEQSLFVAGILMMIAVQEIDDLSQ